MFVRWMIENLQHYKNKNIAWLDTCLLYSVKAELHYSLSDYNVSTLLSILSFVDVGRGLCILRWFLKGE